VKARSGGGGLWGPRGGLCHQLAQKKADGKGVCGKYATSTEWKCRPLLEKGEKKIACRGGGEKKAGEKNNSKRPSLLRDGVGKEGKDYTERSTKEMGEIPNQVTREEKEIAGVARENLPS